MSLEQYNVQTNPFLALSKAIGAREKDGTKQNLAHSMIMQQAHHQSVMQHLERTHQLQEEGKNAEHARSLEALTKTQQFAAGQAAKQRAHETRIEGTRSRAEIQKTKILGANEIEKLKLSHQQNLESTGYGAAVKAEAETGTHQRRLEMLKAVTKAAESGTKVSFGTEDARAEFVKKKPKPRAPKAVETPSAVSAPAPVQENKPSVNRDPKTGQAVSLNPEKAKKATTRKKK